YLQFQDNSIIIFKGGGLEIGYLLIGIPAVKTTRTMDFIGMHTFIDPPADQIHGMGTIIAKFRSTGIPIPVPIVMKPVFAKRPVRGWPKEHIPVHAFRYGDMLDMTYISPVAINNGPS